MCCALQENLRRITSAAGNTADHVTRGWRVATEAHRTTDVTAMITADAGETLRSLNEPMRARISLEALLTAMERWSAPPAPL
jgi:hypothetical protein